jgi:hypothetical protein
VNQFNKGTYHPRAINGIWDDGGREGGREGVDFKLSKQRANYLLKNDTTYHHYITRTLQHKSFLNIASNVEKRERKRKRNNALHVHR